MMWPSGKPCSGPDDPQLPARRRVLHRLAQHVAGPGDLAGADLRPRRSRTPSWKQAAELGSR
ncbi:hypothetical protein ACU4GD_33575 [Cupriavidus basilensis]